MANQDTNLEKIDAVFLTKTRLQLDSVNTDRWVIREFWVKEDIGRPYHGTVDIITSQKSVDFSKLLGKSCVLKISRGANRERFFKGIVSRVELLGIQHGKSAAKINFAPALHALEYGRNTRIFADKTGPQIVDEVLREALAPFDRQVKMQCLRKYALREYTVQYKESDFNFISRLMSDEGLTFYYDQKSQEHELIVVVDSNEAHVEIETMGEKIVPAEPVKQGLEEWATAGQTALDASNFVEIELKDDAGNPIPKAPYLIKLPNGRVLDYELSGDGWANVPIAKHPSCQVSFSSINQPIQKNGGDGQAPSDGQTEYKPKKQHVVAPGECILSIADHEGFLWKQIWNMESNRKLRDLRMEPNLLAPGDVVQIPEKKITWYKCDIGKKNSFVVKRAMVEIRVQVHFLDGPRKNEPYYVEIDGVVYPGKTERTDEDGLAVCLVPATATRAMLMVGDAEDEYELLIGHMDPPDTIAGLHARLENLGFDTGGVDTPWDGQSANAMRSFFTECKSGEEEREISSEDIDDASKKAVIDEYCA